MKKHWTAQMGNFLAGKGFYIVLLLCFALIGVSGYYFYNTVSDSQVTTVSEVTAITVTPTVAPTATPKVEAVEPIQPTATAAPEPMEEEILEEVEDAVEEVVLEVEEVVEEVVIPEVTPVVATFYSWPLLGDIFTDHSVEALAYDVTMEDWRTHAGIDIIADLGSDVYAAGDGTVLSVEDTDLMGTTVVIDHGNGITSTYANLAVDPAVTVGEVVYAGQTIGAVGDTAIAESALPAHLHFEMALSGEAVDPMDYLPSTTN